LSLSRLYPQLFLRSFPCGASLGRRWRIQRMAPFSLCPLKIHLLAPFSREGNPPAPPHHELLASMIPPYRSSFGCSEIVEHNKSFSPSTRALAIPHCATSAALDSFRAQNHKDEQEANNCVVDPAKRTQSSLIYPTRRFHLFHLFLPIISIPKQEVSASRNLLCFNFSGIRSFPLSSDFLI
jgi:hypothetical protein